MLLSEGLGVEVYCRVEAERARNGRESGIVPLCCLEVFLRQALNKVGFRQF